MSTDYGVVCKDCVEIFWWDNLHKESAEHLLADATHLADIAELISKLRSEEVRIDLEYQEGVDVWFFEDHRGHNLVVLNEYEWTDFAYPPTVNLHDPEPDPIYYTDPVEAEERAGFFTRILKAMRKHA